MYKISKLIITALFFYHGTLSALPCYLTIVKDSCWIDYNVTVNALDMSNNEDNVLTVKIPQGQKWARGQFECKPAQTLKFTAQFTPNIWQDDANAIYNGSNFWVLPQEITPNTTLWNITLCFPQKFSAVPAPAKVVGNCLCDTTQVPEITQIKSEI